MEDLFQLFRFDLDDHAITFHPCLQRHECRFIEFAEQ